MPHQCTNCGRAFDDGSKEMLSGCPDCGGNKFQFKPGDAASTDAADSADTTGDSPEPPEPPEPPGPDSAVARTVGNAAATVRDIVGGSSQPAGAPGPDGSGSPREPPAAPLDGKPRENAAQADARSAVVNPEEMPGSDGWEPTEPAEADDAPPSTDTATHVADDPDADSPDLHELREELNDQFESIKVCSPGQYELNLMELYDREEYIIALQEDGRYVIQVPETWDA